LLNERDTERGQPVAIPSDDTAARRSSDSLIRVGTSSAPPVSSRFASMSCSTISQSRSSGKLSTSVTSLRVNSTLPAPMEAILTFSPFPFPRSGVE
jgi:hypothetical protein